VRARVRRSRKMLQSLLLDFSDLLANELPPFHVTLSPQVGNDREELGPRRALHGGFYS